MNRALMNTGLVLAAALTACANELEEGPPRIRSVRYVVVNKTSTSGARVFSGSLEAGNESRLSFQVGGRIQRFPVKVGQKVRKGQLVAEIDPTDLRLRLREAQANVAQARAQANNAAAHYKRTRRMYETQNTSRQELDAARAQRDSAQASYAAALEVLRSADRQLGYCQLEAPANGIINEVSAETNEVVQAGQPIAVLQAGQALEAAIDVPESFIRLVKLGDPAQVTVRAVEATVDGAIQEIGVASAGSGVFPMRVKLMSDPDSARPGMVAEVTLTPRSDQVKPEEGFRVPLTAVGEDRDGRYVFVVQGQPGGEGTVKRTPVKIGSIAADGIQILEGVSEGQIVVTAGVSRIQDGWTVRLPAVPMGERP